MPLPKVVPVVIIFELRLVSIVILYGKRYLRGIVTVSCSVLLRAVFLFDDLKIMKDPFLYEIIQ